MKINDFQSEAKRKNQIKTRIFLQNLLYITRFFFERRCFVCL